MVSGGFTLSIFVISAIKVTSVSGRSSVSPALFSIQLRASILLPKLGHYQDLPSFPVVGAINRCRPQRRLPNPLNHAFWQLRGLLDSLDLARRQTLQRSFGR